MSGREGRGGGEQKIALIILYCLRKKNQMSLSSSWALVRLILHIFSRASSWPWSYFTLYPLARFYKIVNLSFVGEVCL